MAINLLDRFTTEYNESLLRQATHTLGETADSVMAGIDMAAKAILAGIVSKSGTQGLNWMYESMTSEWSQLFLTPTNEIFIQPHLDQFTTSGASILRNLFGEKQNDVIDYLSGHSRLKSSSSSTLLRVIAPLLLHTIKEAAEKTTLGRMDARNLLEEQRPYLQHSLPIDLQTQLGLIQQSTTAFTQAVTTDYTVSPDSPMHVSKLLPWIILLITALGLFYFVEKGCGGTPPAPDEKNEMQVDSTSLDSI